jgi:alcohol dehydrogenase
MSGDDPRQFLAQSLLLHAPERLAWVAEQLPPPGPQEILIETTVGAISGGTELPLYRGTSRDLVAPHYPKMTGYESVGIVRARGAAVEHPALGARVVATYGHRTGAIIPAAKAIPIPETIDDATALLLILSGDVATGIGKLGMPPSEPILVTGAGTIGLLAVFTLACLGATAIDVIEPQANRRDLALAFGARRALAPGDASTLADTYASGIESSSSDTAFATLQSHLRPHGPICILADGNIEPLILTPHFHQRQLLIIGSSDCPDYHAHARWFFPHAARHMPTLRRLFDRRVRRSALPATFAALATGDLAATKVLIEYSDPA